MKGCNETLVRIQHRQDISIRTARRVIMDILELTDDHIPGSKDHDIHALAEIALRKLS